MTIEQIILLVIGGGSLTGAAAIMRGVGQNRTDMASIVNAQTSKLIESLMAEQAYLHQRLDGSIDASAKLEKQLRDQIEQLEREYEDVQRKLASLTDEHKMMSETVIAQRQRLTTLGLEKDKLTEELAAARDELNRLRWENEQLRSQSGTPGGDHQA